MDTAVILTMGRFWAIDPIFANNAIEIIAGITPAEAIKLQEDFQARQRSQPVTEKPYRVVDKVAIIPVKGVLTKAETCAGSLFGGETATPLVTQAIRQSAQDPDVRSRVLDVDSPGGDVSGIGEFARAVAETAKVKPIHAVVNELAASAAMWGISGATSIVGPKGSQAGNVGVYTVLRDTSRATENAGVTVHLIGSSHLKGIGERGVPITPEQLAYMRERLAAMAGQFYGDLSANRKLSEEQLTEIKLAKSYIASEAIRHGLMDGIGNLDDVVKQASQGQVHYSIPGGGVKMKLGELAKMFGIAVAPEETKLADEKLPLTAVLTEEEAATVSWLREQKLSGASGLQTIQAMITANETALTAAREKASKLAVALFADDKDSVSAAEEYINSADMAIVNATITSYEASLRKLGLLDESHERSSAPKSADGDEDRRTTAGDPNNKSSNLAERVSAIELEIRQLNPV